VHAIRIIQRQHNTKPPTHPKGIQTYQPWNSTKKQSTQQALVNPLSKAKPYTSSWSLVKHDQDKETTQKEEVNIPFSFLFFSFLFFSVSSSTPCKWGYLT
jgi:hypothetical protein